MCVPWTETVVRAVSPHANGSITIEKANAKNLFMEVVMATKTGLKAVKSAKASAIQEVG